GPSPFGAFADDGAAPVHHCAEHVEGQRLHVKRTRWASASVMGVHRNSRLRIEYGVLRYSYYARAFGSLRESLWLEKSTVGKVCRRARHETFRHTTVTKLMNGEHALLQIWVTVPI